MKVEVTSATNFLIHMIKLSNNAVSAGKLKKLRQVLIKDLQKKFEYNWFPNQPYRLSEFRCIRIKENKLDPLITCAAIKCGLNPSTILSFLPKTLSIWIDPQEVTYRFDDSSDTIHTLYTMQTTGNVPWIPKSQRNKKLLHCFSYFY